MKKIIISVLKTLLLTVIFAAGIIVPTMLISVSPEVTARLTEDIQNNISRLMLLVSLFGAITLLLNVKLSKERGIKLMLALGFSFWGIEYFQAQIETFYFRDAFIFMSDIEILNNMLRGLITSIIVVPNSVIIFGKRRFAEKRGMYAPVFAISFC